MQPTLERIFLERGDSLHGIHFLRGKHSEYLSYPDLVDRAFKFLGLLQDQGVAAGDEVVFQIADNRTFLSLFWGCLLGRMIPVPLSPATRPEARLKLLKVWQMLQRPHLASAGLGPLKGETEEALALLEKIRSCTIQLESWRGAARGTPMPAGLDDLAYIQFSSGSTGDPKGVALSHRNLLTNIDSIKKVVQSANDSLLSWMPLFHDMGLIGYHLVPMVLDLNHALMPTRLFLRRPMLWMKYASQHQATILGAPDFGFRHLLKAVKRQKAQDWDLSHVRVIFNGGEPISAQVCAAFTKALAPYGLKPNVIFPNYGLAECTLQVSAPPVKERVRSLCVDRARLVCGQPLTYVSEEKPNALALTDVGMAVPHTEIRICDAAGSRLPDDTCGVIEVRGDNVMRGYYRNPIATAKVLSDDGWLRTGDLGFIHEDRLFVIGRENNVLVIGGVNFHSHDLERIAHGVDGIEVQRIVVGGIPQPEGAGQEPVVFLRHKRVDARFCEIAMTLRRRFLVQAGFAVQKFVPVKEIPKTSSGKLMRQRLVSQYLRGDFKSSSEAFSKQMKRSRLEKKAALDADLTAAQPHQRSQVMTRWLEEIALLTVGQIDAGAALKDQGLDSLALLSLWDEIQVTLALDMPTTNLFNFPSLHELAPHLLREYVGEPRQPAAGEQEVFPIAEAAATTPLLDREIQGEAIAVIGIACRFPGGCDTPEAFWELLQSGGQTHGSLNRQGFHGAPCGGSLADLDAFDAPFFQISPREAAAMDPQQRLLLEVCWEALENAALNVKAAETGPVGVFVGLSTADVAAEGSKPSLTGNAASVAAGRLSYFLKIQGPNLAVDTSCSSSLTAVHLAVNSLLAGESQVALAGGVSLLLSPRVHQALLDIKALAPDGRCKTFSVDADGYGRGEGCAVLVLKRTVDALRDKDPIWAQIRGTAVNHDGSSNGLTAPNGQAQKQVIQNALLNARLHPDQIDYIEAHGTGTPLGDPVEFEALCDVFQNEIRHPLWVGSVKTNIGHLEAAAGMAGLVKTILALQHEVIPAHLNAATLHPEIQRYVGKVQVPHQPVDWNRQGRPRFAGISAFGFSGTNAHVIVESCPPKPSRQIGRTSMRILALSAPSDKGLMAFAQRMAAYVWELNPAALDDLCHTMARRAQFRHRLAIVFDTKETLHERLLHSCSGNPTPQIHQDVSSLETKTQGCHFHFASSGFSLPEEFTEWVHCLPGLDEIYQRLVGGMHENEQLGESGPSPARRPGSSLANALGQLAIAQWWQAHGVKPTAVTGTGSGQILAEVALGKMTLAKARDALAAWQVEHGLQSNQEGMEESKPAGELLLFDGGFVPKLMAQGTELIQPTKGNDHLERWLDQHQRTLAELYVRGFPIALSRCIQGSPDPLVPNYPFQKSPLSCETPTMAENLGVTPMNKHGAIQQHLEAVIARQLGLNEAEIDPQTSFLELGADSLTLAEVLGEIKRTYGVDVSMQQVFEELNTLQVMVEFLAEKDHPVPSRTEKLAQAQPPLPIPSVQPVNLNKASKGSGSNRLERMMALQLQGYSDLVAKQLAFLKEEMPHVANDMATSAEGISQEAAAPPPTQQAKRRNHGAWWRREGWSRKLDDPQQAFIERLLRDFRQRTARSAEQATSNSKALADIRHLMGYRKEMAQAAYPIIARRSEAATFEDLDGNQYIDLTMGFGVNLFGHSPKFVTEAMAAQLNTGVHVGPQSERAAAVADLIATLSGLPRVTFCNSGTEGVMAAIRLARTARQRTRLALFSGSYHGHSDSTLWVPGDAKHQALPMVPGVPDVEGLRPLVMEYGDPASLNLIEEHANGLAAVLVEPVQSRRPGLQPKAFIKNLRNLTRRLGIPLIFDEVITGFRIHPGGAQAYFGVRADMVVYGKVLGGGMPIGVVAGEARYLNCIDGGRWSAQGDGTPKGDITFVAGTFCKHPLTLAATEAVLKKLSREGEALLEDLNQKTTQFTKTLNRFFALESVPIEVVHFGSLMRFQYGGNDTYMYQPLEMDLLFISMALRGVYIWEGRTCFLSTAHSDQQLQRVVAVVKDAIRDLKTAGFFSAKSSKKAGLGRAGAGVRQSQQPVLVEPGLQPSPAKTISILKEAFPDLAQIEGLQALAGLFPIVNQVARAGIESTLLHLEPNLREGTRFLERDMAQKMGVVGNRRRLFRRLLQILVDADRLEPCDEAYVVMKDFERVNTDELCGNLVKREARLDDIAELLRRSLKGLGAVLRGEMDPVQVLFPGGDMSLLETIYSDATVSHTVNQLICKALEEHLPKTQADPQLRILEVGAGTGGTTRFVLPLLISKKVTYYFTDVSQFFLLKGQATFKAYDFVEYKLLDLDKDPALQGFELGSFDVVMGAGVLHAVADLKRSLNWLRTLLKPEGALILRETTPGHNWYEVIFGLTEGWWRFTDRELRQDSPLLDGCGWRHIGEQAGYEVDVYPDEVRQSTWLANQIVVVAVPERRPLTSSQRHMGLMVQNLPECGKAYHVSAALKLHGALDVRLLAEALQQVAMRHDALRSVVNPKNNRLSLIPHFRFPFHCVDSTPNAQSSGSLPELMAAEADLEFDLEQGPLGRASLIRTDRQGHVLILTVHHLVADGFSLEIIIREMAACYQAGIQGQRVLLPAPLRFSRFAHWRKDLAASLTVARQEEWYLDYLANLPNWTFPRKAQNLNWLGFQGERITSQMDEPLCRRMKDYSKKAGTTPFMTMLAAFTAVAHQVAETADLSLGIPVAGRHFKGGENLVGYCTHLIAYRSRMQPGATFAEHVSQTRHGLLEVYANQDVSADDCIAKMNLRTNNGRPPLVGVVFNLERSPEELAMEGLQITRMVQPIRYTDLDLSINIMLDKQRLLICCDFNKSLFDREMVKALLESYVQLLDQCLDRPDQSLEAVEGCIERVRAFAMVAEPKPLHVSERPQNALEDEIAACWCDVLALETVGATDNFFDLGGSSLHVVQLLEKLRIKQPDLAIVELFSHPTVRAQAALLAGAEPNRPSINSYKAADDSRIAVIGMAGCFPGAENVDAFWQNLLAGEESITTFSKEELLANGATEPEINDPQFVAARPTLGDVALFDAAFFGYSPSEAEIMDPQHRLFLETAWTALEHAGYTSHASRQISVYAGSNLSTYLLNNLAPNRELLRSVGDLRLSIGNDKDFLATRVSYKLNLTGPSLNLNTACSTSLVAIHQACRDLVAGQCDMALTGGVSIHIPQATGYISDAGGMVSPDGSCRSFDADAGGTIFGNGLGVVVLKPLAKALEDGDTIHAVVLGSAVNNDGSHKVGFTAPSVEGQAAVVAEALQNAGVTPASISYVEAHGTGTRLGDPIEVAALNRVFGRDDERTQPCWLGSVKTNVGHLDTAAGVTGFIKTVFALKNKVLPASLHYRKPNPDIQIDQTPFCVNDVLRSWEKQDGPLRAGVSSFGIGGTNAHVVLEEPPRVQVAASSRSESLILLSGKTETALAQRAADLATYLQAHPEVNLADVGFTLQVGRVPFRHRLAFTCEQVDEALGMLASLPAKYRSVAASDAPNLCFMFPGQGSQAVGMARALYQQEPVFRRWIDRCLTLSARFTDLDLRAYLLDPTTEISSQNTAYAQPGLFIVSRALVGLLDAWGIWQRSMVGHSLGEYVAATCAGVFSLEDALYLVIERGRLMAELPQGAMVTVALSEAEVGAYLEAELDIAAVNGPRRVVVAGDSHAVEKLQESLKKAGVAYRPMATNHAFHSQSMAQILPQLRTCLDSVTLKKPRAPFVSCVSGAWVTPEEATDRAWWIAQARQPVRFAAAMSCLAAEDAVFLEVGPGRALSGLAKQNMGKHATVVSLLADFSAPSKGLSEALGQLWLQGAAVDWQAFHQKEKRSRLPLPTYPFQRQRFWIDPPADNKSAVHGSASRTNDPDSWFYETSWKRSVALEQPVAPGTAVVAFLNESPFAETVLKRLEAAGFCVVVVRPGVAFAQSGDTYALDRCQPEHFERLFDCLSEADFTPRAVLWQWFEQGQNENDVSVETHQEIFFAPRAMAVAMSRHFASAPVQILMATDGLHDVLAGDTLVPEKSLSLGFARVLPKEFPHWQCKCVDIGPCLDPSETADQLIAELGTGTNGQVALRAGYRWLETVATRPAPPVGSPRKAGVFLITGGLGGMGLALAGYLAEKSKGGLILTSLSAFPDREAWSDLLEEATDENLAKQIRAIREIEAHGAKVLVLQADVTSQEDMQGVIAQANTAFGQINGVIHAAGVAGGGLMVTHSREAAEAILAPKVSGARVLATLFAKSDLDFFVMCSSQAAVLGELGHSDYVAANAFLDATARHLRKRGIPVTSINWGPWRETGMMLDALPVGTLGQHFQDSLRQGLATTEGIAAFERVLGSQSAQLIVSPLNFQVELMKSAQMTMAHFKPVGAKAERPAAGVAYVAPETPLEKRLCEIWSEILGIEQIGVNDHFFDLGGDSLLAGQMVTRLQEDGLPALKLDAFFHLPTIRQVAGHLREMGDANQATRRETLRQAVDEMTPAEIRAALEQRRQSKGEPVHG